jgi:ABC-type multidrug transport system fused ATPase/permease subunit
MQASALAIFMVIGVVIEMTALASVIPFLALISDPESITQNAVYLKITQILPQLNMNDRDVILIFFATASLASGLMRTALNWLTLKISFAIGTDVASYVYESILSRSYQWHTSQNTSEIIGGMDKINVLITGVITPIMQLSAAIAISSGIAISLLLINFESTTIAGITFTIIYVLIIMASKSRISENDAIISKNLTKKINALQEGLGGIRDIILTNTQKIYHDRFFKIEKELREAQVSNIFISTSPRYIVEAVGMAIIAGIAYAAIGNSNDATTAIPIIGALAVGAQKILPHMQTIYHTWASIRGNQIKMSDVLLLLDEPNKKKDLNKKFNYDTRLLNIEKKDNYAESKKAPLMQMRDMGFRYAANTKWVFRDINLEIYGGDKIGIIGPTGGGKSTFIDILMGLLRPSEGELFVNGYELYGKKLVDWQLAIAHVPQTIYLIDGTITENIAFGQSSDDIDLKRIEWVINLVLLEEFIHSLPDKYNTRVGERGVMLSGGQRQRIGIARALYRRSKIFVFDEATSALAR